MEYVSEPMNGYRTANQSNPNYTQSYTYSHYYRNRKPYAATKSNSNFKANSQMNSSYQTNSKAKLNSFEKDSLLWNDVYGKQDSPKNSSSRVENSNNSTNPSHTENSDNSVNPSHTENSNHSTTSSTDFSNLFKMFFQNNENSDNSNPFQALLGSNGNGAEMPDIETLLKFKKIFERLNSKNGNHDPIVNLLYAVKPFMQESKRSIIDQIAKFMTISSILQEFNGFI